MFDYGSNCRILVKYYFCLVLFVTTAKKYHENDLNQWNQNTYVFDITENVISEFDFVDMPNEP
jgi:hypothetical protein